MILKQPHEARLLTLISHLCRVWLCDGSNPDSIEGRYFSWVSIDWLMMEHVTQRPVHGNFLYKVLHLMSRRRQIPRLRTGSVVYRLERSVYMVVASFMRWLVSSCRKWTISYRFNTMMTASPVNDSISGTCWGFPDRVEYVHHVMQMISMEMFFF